LCQLIEDLLDLDFGQTVQMLGRGVHHRRKQLLLGGEVVIQGGLRAPHTRRNHRHGGMVITHFLKHLAGNIDDRLTPGFGFDTHAPLLF
jgi:hypothetical protein